MDKIFKSLDINNIFHKYKDKLSELLSFGDSLRRLAGNFWNLKAIVYLYLISKYREGSIIIKPDVLRRVSYVISRRSSILDEFGLIRSQRYQKVENREFSEVGWDFVNACIDLGSYVAETFNVDSNFFYQKFKHIFNIKFTLDDIKHRFLYLILSVFVLSAIFNKSSLRNIRFNVLLSVYFCYRALGRSVNRMDLVYCLKLTGRFKSADNAYVGKILELFSVKKLDYSLAASFFDMFVSWVFTRFKEILSGDSNLVMNFAHLEKVPRVPLLICSEKEGECFYRPNSLCLYFFEKFMKDKVSTILMNVENQYKNKNLGFTNRTIHEYMLSPKILLEPKEHYFANFSFVGAKESDNFRKYDFGVHLNLDSEPDAVFSFGNLIASGDFAVGSSDDKLLFSVKSSSRFDLDNLLGLHDRKSIVRFFKSLASESDDRILSFWKDLRSRTHSNILVFVSNKIKDIYELAEIIIDNIIRYGGSLTIFSGGYIGTLAGDESTIRAHRSYIEKHRLLLKKLDTEYRKIEYERIYLPGSLVFDIYLNLSGFPENIFEKEVRLAVRWLKELIENRRKMNLKIVVNPLAQFNPFSIIVARVNYKIPLYYTELLLYSSGTRRFGTGIFFAEYESPKIYNSLMNNVKILKELNFTIPYQSADIKSYIYDVIVKTTENYLNFLEKTNPEEARVLEKIFDIFKKEYKVLIGLKDFEEKKNNFIL